MNQSRLKVLAILLVVVLAAAFFTFGLDGYLNLEFIKSHRETLQAYYNQHPILSIVIFIGVYIALTSLSLPGGAVLTLAGGALFGGIVGAMIVSFSSTIGATLAFLVARFFLRDHVQSKFGRKLETIKRGIEREGMFYLFTMRLLPAIPFFVVNLLMGLTTIRATQFFFVSQIGMLPGTIIYVNAGTHLANVESLRGILSPVLLLSLGLLGAFPLIAKKSVELIKLARSEESRLRPWTQDEPENHEPTNA